MSTVWEQIKHYLSGLYLPKIQVIDVVEILIIAFLLYFFMAWIQRTRAYTLLKGILIVALFIIVASIFQMTTILWITQKLASIALIALVVIFQPELRKALESLGNKNLLSSIFPFDSSQDKIERFSDQTISEIIRAVNEMSEVRTGALIVIEQKILLTEYINTGIELDSVVSTQLLVNIFEHNTPLHDGAIILRGDRILAATCYLPLSENATISKKFGTRHRAGLGISEVSDAFTVIVSEETGRVSYAYMGNLTTGVTSSDLREQLHRFQKNDKEKTEKKFRIWKGREHYEE
ncbi:MAG TPA: diadenylate cyclase CdaA [Lachnospiraceae bacterium]|nr:diadenylate cyclase CdaA [Lachnospiraceae bacterium]